MQKHDTPLIAPVDLPAALGLLTRLPVIVNGDRAMARGAAAAWAYPLVGVILGGILAAFTAVMTALGLPSGVVAGLVLALSVILTGAMHEDGLADTADGLWGGWTPARRLEIMKDSRIGVYGVCAIALALLLRWLTLTVVVAMGAYWVAFMAVGALSRTSMVVLMGAMRNARSDGLSKKVGRPSPGTVWLAIGFGGLAAILCGFAVLILIAAMATLVCGLIARAKIGGQTGDILGATQQVTEIAMLLTLVVMLT